MPKVVLVSGASKGIGLSLVKELESKGYIVIGLYNETFITDDKIDYYKCDIRNEEEIIELFNYIKNKYHKLDILVNLAAISIDDDIYNKTKEDFMKVLEVNLVGTFLMCKYASLLMDKGIIINISSTNGIDTYTDLSIDYDTSKAGVNLLTKSLSKIFNNIKVYSICPNWVDTDTTLNVDKNYLDRELKRISQKKLIKKEEVVNRIIDLFNSNIESGTIIKIDDGNE